MPILRKNSWEIGFGHFGRRTAGHRRKLAHQSGLARSFAGAIERGEKDVRLSTLAKLANTFKIAIYQLFR